jgi:hypothetical protein
MLKKSSAMNPNQVNPEYFFCLKDQMLAARQNMINLLLQETNHTFKKEWCIKSLLENKDDFEGSLLWLKNNAPSKLKMDFPS